MQERTHIHQSQFLLYSLHLSEDALLLRLLHHIRYLNSQRRLDENAIYREFGP